MVVAWQHQGKKNMQWHQVSQKYLVLYYFIDKKRSVID